MKGSRAVAVAGQSSSSRRRVSSGAIGSGVARVAVRSATDCRRSWVLRAASRAARARVAVTRVRPAARRCRRRAAARTIGGVRVASRARRRTAVKIGAGSVSVAVACGVGCGRSRRWRAAARSVRRASAGGCAVGGCVVRRASVGGCVVGFRAVKWTARRWTLGVVGRRSSQRASRRSQARENSAPRVWRRARLEGSGLLAMRVRRSALTQVDQARRWSASSFAWRSSKPQGLRSSATSSRWPARRSRWVHTTISGTSTASGARVASWERRVVARAVRLAVRRSGRRRTRRTASSGWRGRASWSGSSQAPPGCSTRSSRVVSRRWSCGRSARRWCGPAAARRVVLPWPGRPRHSQIWVGRALRAVRRARARRWRWSGGGVGRGRRGRRRQRRERATIRARARRASSQGARARRLSRETCGASAQARARRASSQGARARRRCMGARAGTGWAWLSLGTGVSA